MAETLETRVTAVVVYPDRARVTRSGTVTLEPGDQRLELSGLPPVLDPASVRAVARGTARARLSGVEVRRVFLSEAPVARVRELEQQIESLEDQRRELESQSGLTQELREAVRGMLRATEIYARGVAFGKSAAEEPLALWDRLQERARMLDQTQQTVGIQRRELERRLAALKAELEPLRGAQGWECYTAAVELAVSQAGELTVELTYVLSGAGWQPLYDLRLHENGIVALEAGYLAQVSQRTGEEWVDVGLTLSTARPALSRALPELEPWMLMPIVVMSAPVTRGGMMRMAMPQATSGRREIEEAAPYPAEPEFAAVQEEAVAPVTAEVGSSGATVTYKVPGSVTIPADGQPHKVTVAHVTWTPVLDYLTAPKLVEASYRRAKVRNDSPYTFLPGTANLFIGDEFLGAAPLALLAPNGEMELALGTDDRIKVERKLVRREVDRKLLGDRRRIRFAYEIRLESYLNKEARVTVTDQIPVSRHESIKVRWEAGEPGPTEQTEMGKLRWELILGAQEKKVLRFEFSVEHPRDMDVTGLP